MSVAFGCCVGSWDKVQRFVLPRFAGQLFVGTSGQTSIARAYNSILDGVDGRGLDALVLLHDDLEVTDPLAITKVLAAFEDPEVALVGVAGGGGDSIAWWNHNPIGHQQTDSALVDFGQRTGDVEALEGSFIAFSPWAISNLRFDEGYHGFHGYDCDISAQARAAGARVVVADIDTHHHSTLGFKSKAIAEEWGLADKRFRRKWQ